MTIKRIGNTRKILLFSAYLGVVSANVIASSAMANDRSGEHKPKRPVFSNIDLNADGEISLDEFNELTLPRGENEGVFNDIDEDGNGVISQSEFSSHKPPRPPKK